MGNLRIKKFHIVGQGLAGSILALRLYLHGATFKIYDKPSLSTSSRVAAGLINPIVLKRLKWVQDAELFMPAVQPFYQEWEKVAAHSFLHDLPLKHLLENAAEANLWMEKSAHPPLSDYLGPVQKNDSAHLNAPFGYGLIPQIPWLNTREFLKWCRAFFLSKQLLEEREITKVNLDHRQPNIHWLLTNGHLARKLVPEVADYFQPTRGETLIAKIPELPQSAMYHRKVFLIPLGNQLFKVGATYHWDRLSDETSLAGLEQLENGIQSITNHPYTVLEHEAGVRPNIKDRKPLLGEVRKGLSLFNGMGSRAALMAPYLSEVFAQHLLYDAQIPSRWSLQRFHRS